MDDGEKARRVDWYLAETGLSGLRRFTAAAAVGRSAATCSNRPGSRVEPEVLLLDEPLGALDVQTKEDMQVFIRRVWNDTGSDSADGDPRRGGGRVPG